MFNYDKVVFTEHPVLVLKGEIPVMLLSQYGFWACSPTGGEAVLMDDKYRAALSFSAKRVLVGDNDRDPQVRERMQAKAQERAEFLRAELRFPPEIYKDIDDWLLADPVAALPAIKCWLE